MSEANSPTPSIEEEEEEEQVNDEEEVESFREWMGFVNRCLSGRLTQEDTGGNEKEEVGVTHTYNHVILKHIVTDRRRSSTRTRARRRGT